MNLWATYLIEDNNGGADTISYTSLTLSADADFDGDGSAETRVFARGTDNVSVDTYQAIVDAGSSLDQLVWEPGLLFTAQVQADDLENATSLTSTGSDGSTFAERLAEYGTAGSGATELIQGSTDSATWVVLSMLISDADTSDAGRTALLSSTVSQGGVASVENDTFGYVYVTVVDSDFVEDADECACEEEETVVVEPDTAAGLIVAGTAAMAAALLI